MEKDKAIMDINAKLDIIADRMMEIEKEIMFIKKEVLERMTYKITWTPAKENDSWREPDDKEGF